MANQPRQGFDGEIAGVVVGAAGRPFLRGNMTNQGGVLLGIQLETRRPVRQPAYIFRGAAHQAVGLADDPVMETAAQRLNEAEDQTLRSSSLEKRQPARFEQITDEA